MQQNNLNGFESTGAPRAEMDLNRVECDGIIWTTLKCNERFWNDSQALTEIIWTPSNAVGDLNGIETNGFERLLM